MFSLFKKKDPGISITDKIVIGETAKLEAMLAAWHSNNDLGFIFWFDESLEQATSFFASRAAGTVTLLSAREAGTTHRAPNTLIFAEHYPLRSKEEELYRKMNLESATVYSSLQEPLFRLFGSEKIIQLMQKMGTKDDEVIEHKMVSRAIRDAQEKIEKKLLIEQTARSQKDWLEKNL